MATPPIEPVLGFEGRLPLQLQPLAVHPSPAELDAWREHSLRALHAMALLEERSTPLENGAEAEMERVHQKLDLLLTLVSQLLQPGTGEGLVQRVRLTAEGITLDAVDPLPAPDSLLLVTLGLHARAPMPLRWPARVQGVNHGRLRLHFLPMSEGLQTALERFVFTHHRRSVAGSRSPNTLRDAAG